MSRYSKSTTAPMPAQLTSITIQLHMRLYTGLIIAPPYWYIDNL